MFPDKSQNLNDIEKLDEYIIKQVWPLPLIEKSIATAIIREKYGHCHKSRLSDLILNQWKHVLENKGSIGSKLWQRKYLLDQITKFAGLLMKSQQIAWWTPSFPSVWMHMIRAHSLYSHCMRWESIKYEDMEMWSNNKYHAACQCWSANCLNVTSKIKA